ncbi:hypothetical protein M436DRAFT_63592 [Aureobasidium namibiae CBS 147.97]|uniref:Uncharacterized protein n=1 Tax=Aureobasidium namibiae CBS 147.97 TaxID=1043004 RepID=A0A074WNV7_9PEZI
MREPQLSELREAFSSAITKFFDDPPKDDAAWAQVDGRSKTPLKEGLYRLEADGYALNEFKTLRALGYEKLSNETITSWMIDEILRFLPKHQIECQKISPVLGSISQRLFVIAKNISQMLPGYHDPLSFPNYLHYKQLNRERAALQRFKDRTCYDHDTGTPEPVSKNAGAPESSDKDDHYKVLTERVQAVEEMLKAKEIKWRLRYEHAMQAYQPTFWDLSDASDSSTGVLTPASTVSNESSDERNSMGVAQTATAPLKLHVCIYNGAILRHSHQGGLTLSILVRMHPNAPFRDLTEKLRKRCGDHTLALHNTPHSQILDSDTPVSLKLKNNAKLVYVTFCDEYMIIDLAMDWRIQAVSEVVKTIPSFLNTLYTGQLLNVENKNLKETNVNEWEDVEDTDEVATDTEVSHWENEEDEDIDIVEVEGEMDDTDDSWSFGLDTLSETENSLSSGTSTSTRSVPASQARSGNAIMRETTYAPSKPEDAKSIFDAFFLLPTAQDPKLRMLKSVVAGRHQPTTPSNLAEEVKYQSTDVNVLRIDRGVDKQEKMLVRIHKTTPFRHLKDKLRNKDEDACELTLKDLRREFPVFDK